MEFCSLKLEMEGKIVYQHSVTQYNMKVNQITFFDSFFV